MVIISFKQIIHIKHIRFAAGTNAVEKWSYNVACAALEKPLLTTFLTMTAFTLLLALVLLSLVVFATVACVVVILLLLEGFFLVVTTAAFCLIVTVCLYIYTVAELSLCVYYKQTN